MEEDYSKCGVCIKGHPIKRVRSVLFPENNVLYCTLCAEMGAEPIGLVNQFLAFHPVWTLTPDFIEDVHTWDGEKYISLADYIEEKK